MLKAALLTTKSQWNSPVRSMQQSPSSFLPTLAATSYTSLSKEPAALEIVISKIIIRKQTLINLHCHNSRFRNQQQTNKFGNLSQVGFPPTGNYVTYGSQIIKIAC
jgi:hypothetical protein